MANGSFRKLLDKAKERDDYWVAKAISDFTEDIGRLMAQREVSKAELARRIDSSAAYITKVMRGDTNFTVESMVRLARAVDGKLCIHVGRREDEVRWFDVVQRNAARPVPNASGFRWIDVDEHSVEESDDEPGTAVA